MELNGYLYSGDRQIAQIYHGRLTAIDSARLPLYLAAGGDVEKWLTDRAIDRHRPNSRILKKVLRLTDSSDLAAVLRAHAATITDNYWLRFDGENLNYGDIQFSEDTFSDIALTGSFDSYEREYKKEQLAAGSPELTNIGSYEKCWRLVDGRWFMYKAGNSLERFSELFISRLGTALGFEMAEYLPDDSFIKTPDFTRGIYNFEPAAAIVGEEEDYAFNYTKLSLLGSSIGPQYLDILYMDALCFNMDRHTQNYGILRDRETGKIIGMAPNFDNNIALISRGYVGDASRTNGFLIDLFVELLSQCHLSYHPPAVDTSIVQSIAQEILPDETVDRDFVTTMIVERAQRLERKIQEAGMTNIL